jgi:2-hydroxycyclohexanecarboxyl-CoA dehydrogenase
LELGFEGQVAIVIGGASGIGAATARLFCEEGAHIEIWDRDLRGVELAHQLCNAARPQAGNQTAAAQTAPRAVFREVDITSQSACEAAAAAAATEWGQFHHAVLAAAIGSGKFGFPYTNLQPSDWLRVLEVNIMGMVHVAHALGPRLRAWADGSLTFLGSVAGQIGSQTDPPYSASKAANINFMQCLARDLAPHGVRVNLVNPGMVQTPLNRSVWQAWHDQQPPEARRSYDDWAGDKVRRVVPLGRWQTPEDIAAMLVFLSSRRAASVTGQTINVDGGFVMRG